MNYKHLGQNIQTVRKLKGMKQQGSFWKGNAVGVGQGRICNTALRIHVIVPRNCDK